LADYFTPSDIVIEGEGGSICANGSFGNIMSVALAQITGEDLLVGVLAVKEVKSQPYDLIEVKLR